MILVESLINSDGMSSKPTDFLDQRAMITRKISVGKVGLRYMDGSTRLETNLERVVEVDFSEFVRV